MMFCGSMFLSNVTVENGFISSYHLLIQCMNLAYFVYLRLLFFEINPLAILNVFTHHSLFAETIESLLVIDCHLRVCIRRT